MSNRDKPAPLIPPAEWEKHRDTIKSLYIVQNRRLQDVVSIMAKDHGFKATEAQYYSQLRSWDMKKNKRNYTRAGPYRDDDKQLTACPTFASAKLASNGPRDKRQRVSVGPPSMEDSDSTPERRVALLNSTQAVPSATTSNSSTRPLVTDPHFNCSVGQQANLGTGGMFGQSGSSMMPGIQSAMPMIGNQTFPNDFGPYYQTPMATWSLTNQPQDLQGDTYQHWSNNLSFEPFAFQPMNIIEGTNEQVPQAVPSIHSSKTLHNPGSRARHQPIHVAAHAGNFLGVEFLLGKAPDCADAVDERNISPLFMAAQEGHLKIIDLLLKHKVDVQRAVNGGRTPIHQAAQNGHTEVVRLLLEAGAKACPEQDSLDTDTPSPFWLAAQKGYISIGKLLIKQGADPEFVHGDLKCQPIHVVAHRGHVDFIRLLIEHQVNLDAREGDGWTALMIATQEGYVEIVELLLKCGANVNATKKDNGTALWIASQQGHMDIVRTLHDYEAKVIATKGSRRRPIHQAAQNGHLDVVKFLVLEFEEDVNAEDAHQITPLMLASSGKEEVRLEMMKFLHSKGAKAQIT